MPFLSSIYLRLFVLLAALFLCIDPAVSVPSRKDHDGYKDKCEHKYDYKGGRDRKVIRVRERESIQEAIDCARPYTRIEVEGHHREQVSISKDGITLIGKGAKLSPPGRIDRDNYCYGKVKAGAELRDVSAGICIHGRKIKLIEPYDPAALHYRVESVGDPVKDVTVSGFEISDFDGENIAVYGGKNTKISRNRLQRGLRYGFLTVGSRGTQASDNVVSGSPPSTLSDGPIAMCMDDLSSAVFSSNDISDYFIGLCTETSEGVNKNNKIRKCCLGNIIDPGVSNAKSLDNDIGQWNRGCNASAAAGISLLGSKNGLVRGNKIDLDLGPDENGAGLFLGDFFGPINEGNTITKNIFGKNPADIFNDSAGQNNIFDNTCDVPLKGPLANFTVVPEYCQPRG